MGRDDILLVPGDGKLADKDHYSQTRRTWNSQEGDTVLSGTGAGRFHPAQHGQHNQSGI